MCVSRIDEAHQGIADRRRRIGDEANETPLCRLFACFQTDSNGGPIKSGLDFPTSMVLACPRWFPSGIKGNTVRPYLQYLAAPATVTGEPRANHATGQPGTRRHLGTRRPCPAIRTAAAPIRPNVMSKLPSRQSEVISSSPLQRYSCKDTLAANIASTSDTPEPRSKVTNPFDLYSKTANII
jgi:hypothetical protein